MPQISPDDDTVPTNYLQKSLSADADLKVMAVLATWDGACQHDQVLGAARQVYINLVDSWPNALFGTKDSQCKSGWTWHHGPDIAPDSGPVIITAGTNRNGKEWIEEDIYIYIYISLTLTNQFSFGFLH